MRPKVFFMLLAVLIVMASSAWAEDSFPTTQDFYMMQITDPGQTSASWHQMTGFEGIACTPEDAGRRFTGGVAAHGSHRPRHRLLLAHRGVV